MVVEVDVVVEVEVLVVEVEVVEDVEVLVVLVDVVGCRNKSGLVLYVGITREMLSNHI